MQEEEKAGPEHGRPRQSLFQHLSRWLDSFQPHSIIRLACIIHRTGYWRRGRTLDKLGIDQMSVNELTGYVTKGEKMI